VKVRVVILVFKHVIGVIFLSGVFVMLLLIYILHFYYIVKYLFCMFCIWIIAYKK